MPNDEEAKRSIASLTVQKQRSSGKFDDDDDDNSPDEAQEPAAAGTEPSNNSFSGRFATSPTRWRITWNWPKLYVNDDRFAEAEKLLAKAYELSDGDNDVREKWEDSQLRALRQKIARRQRPRGEERSSRAEYLREGLGVLQSPGRALSEQSGLQVRAWLPLHEDPAIRRGDPGAANGEERPTPPGDVHARPRRVFPADQAVSGWP